MKPIRSLIAIRMGLLAKSRIVCGQRLAISVRLRNDSNERALTWHNLNFVTVVKKAVTT